MLSVGTEAHCFSPSQDIPVKRHVGKVPYRQKVPAGLALATCRKAFDATWAVIQADDPSLDKDRAQELNTDITRKIVALPPKA
jgi:hypothetical protein